MFKSLLKKLILGLTITCVAGITVAASACTVETAHPAVRITVEFNQEEYELDYTLYRNMYPNTVRHFIELADNGFYNDMLIHDYGTQDWLTGGYAYNEQDYTSASTAQNFADYLERYSKEEGYISLFEAGKLTSTVFSNINPENDTLVDPLPTLIGEFSNNVGQEIENGALNSEYGSLKMIYYSKTTTQKVYVLPTEDQPIMADYKTNCATSIFSMQVGSSTGYSASNYCVFGRVSDVSTLDELIEAVQDYLETQNGTSISDQTRSITVAVDGFEEFSNEAGDVNIEQTFRLARTPIIIKSVKVTKY